MTAVFRARLGEADCFYFAGVNVENPDHRVSTHGEEGAIAAMVVALGKEARIVEGWVMGAPRGLAMGTDNPLGDVEVSCCGKCRQQIANFADEDVADPLGRAERIDVDHDDGPLSPRPVHLPPVPARGRAGRGDTIATPDRRADRAATGPRPPGADIRRNLRLAASRWSRPTPRAAPPTPSSCGWRTAPLVAGVKIEEAAFQDVNAIQCAAAIANAAFGRITVAEDVVVLRTATRQKPDDTFVTPHLSALQTLLEFAQSPEMPIHLFNKAGEQRDLTLAEATRQALTPT